MKLLTNDYLDEYLSTFITAVKYRQPDFYPILSAMYYTGLRFSDLEHPHRIGIIDNKLHITEQKTKQLRVIPITKEIKEYVDIINSEVTYSELFRYNRVKTIISQYYYPLNFKCGNKLLYCHVFRHNYARKQLFTNGLTELQVAVDMSETSLQNIRGYLYTPIYLVP